MINRWVQDEGGADIDDFEAPKAFTEIDSHGTRQQLR